MDWENQSPDFEYGSDRQISDERLKHCEENCGVVVVVVVVVVVIAVVVLLCFDFPFLVGKGATWPTMQLTSKHLEISGFLNWNPRYFFLARLKKTTPKQLGIFFLSFVSRIYRN